MLAGANGTRNPTRPQSKQAVLTAVSGDVDGGCCPQMAVKIAVDSGAALKPTEKQKHVVFHHSLGCTLFHVSFLGGFSGITFET